MSIEEIDSTPEPSSWDLHLPFCIFAFGIAIYMLGQVTSGQQGGRTMKWQLENIGKQIEGTAAQQKLADEQSQKMIEPTRQVNQLQSRYTALLTDLVELSKDDADAKKVVQKYGIQRNEPKAAPAEEEKKP